MCVCEGYNNEESNSQADMFAMSPSPPRKGETKDPKRKNEKNHHEQPHPPMPAVVII